MLRSLVTVVFSAGLLLTAAAGAAVADSDCRAQGDQQNANRDPRCEQDIIPASDATDGTAGDPADNMNDQPDGEGQESDNAG